MSLSQIKGMMLEEVIFRLLRNSGYQLIELTDVGKPYEPTLNRNGAGITVQGRGAEHQIDCIADFLITPPFCPKQRLLVEAKFHSKPIGVEVLRGAVGVLKDVNEYYRSNSYNAENTRVHCQYARTHLKSA